MSKDPRSIVALEPMSRFQVLAVAICVCLNALDGFDVLSISFAAPGIAREWGIDRAALGFVLSIELFGMALGSVVLGNVADKVGRRPTLLLCLLTMTVGMFLAATSNTVEELSIYRLITGFGIGGVLAAINAVAAEYSNNKNRAMLVAIMATGYPMGAIIGGSVASFLLGEFGWRSIFYFGTIMTAVLVPVTAIWLPESVDYVMKKRPGGALKKINRLLKRMKRSPIDSLPPEDDDPVKVDGIRRLFSGELVSLTVLMTFAYFAHIMTFYFILKWIPKLVTDLGFSPSLAGSVLVWANVGGATGAFLFSFLTRRFSPRPLVVGAMIFGAVMVVYFGAGHDTLASLAFVAAVAGFFTNAAIVGIYAMVAQAFPTSVRATGTGFVIGVGRGGAAAGPLIAGLLFSNNMGLQSVALIMAMGSLVAALTLSLPPITAHFRQHKTLAQ